MKTCPRCGYELDTDEPTPVPPFDETTVPMGEEIHPGADAATYLILKKKKRKRTVFLSAALSFALFLAIIGAMVFWLKGGKDKPTQATQKADSIRAGEPQNPDLSAVLDALSKVRGMTAGEVSFSDYTKAVNDAMIDLNALPQDASGIRKLRDISNYYQAAKDIWMNSILLDNTPLVNVEETTFHALTLLNLLDPNTKNCRKDLEKKEAALCGTLGVFNAWKQKGTYANKDDKRRIKERLDPIRHELWKKAAQLLDG